MFQPDKFIDPKLTLPDRLVLQNLLRGIDRRSPRDQPSVCIHMASGTSVQSGERGLSTKTEQKELL